MSCFRRPIFEYSLDPGCYGNPLPDLIRPTRSTLCASPYESVEPRVRRWRTDTEMMVVYVPAQTFEAPAQAIALQSAAAAGIRAWNGQPFRVRVELLSGEEAHFAVTWARSLGGRVLGAARTHWSSTEGFTATSIDLVTRNPADPGRTLEPDRVRLAAAHEMGHTLGLPHSDSDREVMYPQRTVRLPSALATTGPWEPSTGCLTDRSWRCSRGSDSSLGPHVPSLFPNQPVLLDLLVQVRTRHVDSACGFCDVPLVLAELMQDEGPLG